MRIGVHCRSLRHASRQCLHQGTVYSQYGLTEDAEVQVHLSCAAELSHLCRAALVLHICPTTVQPCQFCTCQAVSC